MTFDVATYAATAQALRWDDLDLDEFRSAPLSPDALRCLRYMSDVETHTVCYLRDLLVTPSHTDPEVTTFLTMWNWEEYWHGEVLDDVLAVHGVPTGPEHTRALRKRLGWQDRISPIVQSVIANVLGADFVATHMTWGAINEWCTHAGYSRFIEVEDSPMLTEILRRIAKQETRHISFYNSQARARLENNPRAQRITRFALKHKWGIVGSGVMPAGDVRHLLTYLFGGADGLVQARKIDTKIDTLPGLRGLHLVERELHRYGIIEHPSGLSTAEPSPRPHRRPHSAAARANGLTKSNRLRRLFTLLR